MIKYIFTTKEVAKKLNERVEYIRILAKRYLKKEKLGGSYLLNRHDVEKLRKFLEV